MKPRIWNKYHNRGVKAYLKYGDNSPEYKKVFDIFIKLFKKRGK